MEGLLKFNDLEEHFSNSLTIIDQQNEIIKGKHNLQIVVNKLSEEVEILKDSERKLTQHLKTLSCSTINEDGIHSLYVKLKEKYNELQEKFNQLENEKLEVAEKCKLEKSEITQDLVRQMKVLEEIKENQQQEFLKTQNNLQNKLEAQQAAADIRYDEMESHLKSEISDISKKLYDSVRSCNTMRQELFNFKTYNNSDIDSAKKRIQELERELRLSKQQLQLNEQQHARRVNVYQNNDNLQREINQPQPTSVESGRPLTNIIKNRNILYNENASTCKPNYVYGTSKYPSLNNTGSGFEQEAPSSEEFSEQLRVNVNPHMVPLRNLDSNVNSSRYDSRQNNKYLVRENINAVPEPLKNLQIGTNSTLRYDTKQNNNKYSLPPLKQLSVAQPNPKIQNVKKRKLYNPTNLDYLLDMESGE